VARRGLDLPQRHHSANVLFRNGATCYPFIMTDPAQLIDDDEGAAEVQALAAAIAASDADPGTASHEDVRAWLLRIANGEFDAPPPSTR
jgi:hypothetical protein